MAYHKVSKKERERLTRKFKKIRSVKNPYALARKIITQRKKLNKLHKRGKL